MRIERSLLGLCLAACVAGSSCLAAAEPVAHPPVTELVITPAKLELNGIRDARKVLVQGKAATGEVFDLSGEAKLTVNGEAVTLTNGFVTPKAAGEAKLVIEAGGKQTEIAVVVKEAAPTPVNFIREIEPAMSKVGCNQGTCHGAQDGKAGFKLSLRGYDPEYDYNALIDDLSGRRFNRAVPSQSLMLLKPTQGVPHVGGFLFDENSREYALIQQWISEGCQFVPTTRVTKLEVFPANPVLPKEGYTQQQMVIASYEDGTTRDVTADAVFSSSNFNVASVENTGAKNGSVTALRRGETSMLVRYEGAYAANMITVLGDRTGFVWAPAPVSNFIDQHVNAKLERMKTLPSELCTDAEFLRRVSLDLTGLPPSVEAAKAFLTDPRDSKTKREAKIDELLASTEYIDHWTLKWSDLLLANRKLISEKGVWSFRNWIRNALATNKSYDAFVSELVTASGSTFESPAANYYRVSREPRIVMENMTQVFLGTRFSCNRCHDHPFERWTQNQYYQLSAYFATVGRKPGTQPEEEIIFPSRHPEAVINPRSNVDIPPAYPYVFAGFTEPQGDRRTQVASWLTSKDNPYFAASIVNRYWSYLNGRGIIDPVDDIRSSNPPSNPELLKALSEDFVAHKMDLKHLLRTITSSYTYQRSFLANKWNDDDAENYSHFIPRRLTAEQLFDAIMIATGSPVNLPGVPAGFRATQLPDPNIQIGFLDMFGRAPREIPCECERASDVSLAQTLNLINGPTVADAIVHPQGVIAKAIAANADDKTLLDEIYLSVINRRPTDEEAQTASQYLATLPVRAEAAQDLMWALMNSPAFLFNR